MWIYDFLWTQVKIPWICDTGENCACFIILTAVLITSKCETVKFCFVSLSYTLQLFFNFMFYAYDQLKLKESNFNLIQKLIVQHILPVSLVFSLQIFCLKQCNCSYSQNTHLGRIYMF